jgi:peptidyl-prolyl cis-trans isomerase D
VFNAAQGVEADAVDLSDGGYAWFDVLGITPQAQRPYEAAEADVKARWLDTEKSKALTEAVAKLVERALKGESLETLAKEAGGKVETTAAMTRVTSPPGLTADAVRQAFGLPKGAVSSSATADGASRTVFRVKDVMPAAAPTAEQAERIRAELERAARLDALNTYGQGLLERYGANVNQQVFNQTLGLDRNAQ